MIKFGKVLKNVDRRLPMMVKALSQSSEILAIYLFGSRATNTADDLSDIDIALLLKRGPCGFNTELDLLNKINTALETDEVSLVILNNAPLVIRHGVIKEAKVLYSADDDMRLRFEESIMKKYYDFSHYLDIYDREFISLMKYGRVS